MELDIILQAHAFDQRQLGFQFIDMMFFALQNGGEQVAADIVAHFFAMFDRIAQQRNRFMFQRKVGFENFLHIFANAQAAKQLAAGALT